MPILPLAVPGKILPSHNHFDMTLYMTLSLCVVSLQRLREGEFGFYLIFNSLLVLSQDRKSEPERISSLFTNSTKVVVFSVEEAPLTALLNSAYLYRDQANSLMGILWGHRSLAQQDKHYQM